MMAEPEVLQPVDHNLPAPSESEQLDEEDAEETDEFVTASNGGTTRPVFDLSMLEGVPGANINNAGGNSPAYRRRTGGGGTDSVATTADLASDVGSVMMLPKEAFMKSFTFYSRDNLHWGIRFGDQQVTRGKLLRNNYRLPVASIDDNSIFALSRIRPGDYLKSINGKAVGPSFNGERALSKMKSTLERDGFLTVITKNKEETADDILVHATIVKPSPEMTLAELGMTVWIWGYLCIKSIRRDTIFRHTALKETDNIVSVNEIVCQNVTPEGFAHIIKQLPDEITITVLRRKQRSTGAFR